LALKATEEYLAKMDVTANKARGACQEWLVAPVPPDQEDRKVSMETMARMARMVHLAPWVPLALAEHLAQEVSPAQEGRLGLQGPLEPKAFLVRRGIAASKATKATEERQVTSAFPV